MLTKMMMKIEDDTGVYWHIGAILKKNGPPQDEFFWEDELCDIEYHIHLPRHIWDTPAIPLLMWQILQLNGSRKSRAQLWIDVYGNLEQAEPQLLGIRFHQNYNGWSFRDSQRHKVIQIILHNWNYCIALKLSILRLLLYFYIQVE